MTQHTVTTAPRGLPVAGQSAEGACCSACAAAPALPAAPQARAALAARPVSRTADRRITVGGVSLAVGFIVASALSAVLPETARLGLWLPLHLALAGAAGTAVAAVLPFFTAALRSAPAAPPVARVVAIGLVASGAAAASIGFAGGTTPLAVVGGVAYLGGLVVLGGVAFRPMRRGLGVRRPLVEAAYAVAIVQVVVGVSIVVAYLGGMAAVVERWGALKPAHAWLNVFGFITIVIAATLVHLGPTVAGTRIRSRRSTIVALVGLMAGPVIVALGFAFGADLVARVGGAVAVVGAVALVAHSVGVYRDRGRWTTDAAWHRLTSGSLLVAPAWLAVAVVIATAGILSFGAQPAAWALGAVAAPLALGWVAQVLIGAWSHLLPAIGPGDQAVHAAQRSVLGRAGSWRVLGLNAGVLLLTVAGLMSSSLDWLVIVGGALVLIAIGSSVLAFVAALVLARASGSELARS